MKSFSLAMGLALLAASLAVLTSPPTAWAQSDQELVALEKEIDRAYLANDAAALDKIFADGYTVVLGDGNVSSRKDELEKVRSGDLRVEVSHVDEVQTRVFGDTALVSARLTNSGKFKGESFSSNERISDFWVRTGGRWKLLASQSTPIQPDDHELIATIRAATQKLVAAANGRDATALASMYTHDAECLPPELDPLRGRLAIEQFWKNVLATGTRTEKAVTLDVTQVGDCAHENGKYVLTDQVGQVVEAGKYMVVWKKEDAQWKVFREMWNTTCPVKQP